MSVFNAVFTQDLIELLIIFTSVLIKKKSWEHYLQLKWFLRRSYSFNNYSEYIYLLYKINNPGNI